jgi:hypothetical protein
LRRVPWLAIVGDGSRDVLIERLDDLRTVLPVHLVAVVVLRVVRSRHLLAHHHSAARP